MSASKGQAFVFTSHSSEETIAFGKRVGALLQAGDVIILTGDLGAGKTQFTKGVADGLGIEASVTSPTFTIEMVYKGAKNTLYHFDLYRLSEAEELDDIGLFEAMDSDGPCLIEWGEQFIDEIGDPTLMITIELGPATEDGSEPYRKIQLLPKQARGQELITKLTA